MEGDGSGSASLRTKISELERKRIEEKERFDLLQFAARQEAEKHARDCSSLRENVARLEKDCALLRERGLWDQDRIKGLLEGIERKEIEFREKFIALKDEIRDLECAKIRAENELDEWKNKYLKEIGQVEAWALKIVEENACPIEKGNAKGKEPAIEVDEEMPRRSADEDLVLTPEPMREGNLKGVDSVSEDDEENVIPIAGLLEMKPRLEMVLGKESLDNIACAQIPVHQKDMGILRISEGLLDVVERECRRLVRTKNNRSSRLKKKLKPVDLIRSPAARNQKSSKSSRLKKKLEVSDFSCYATERDLPAVNCNDIAGEGYQSPLKRIFKSQTSQKYSRRIVYTEKQLRALERAEEIRRNLKSCHPTFVKSMTRSCVSVSFWLVIPRKFCKQHLSDSILRMVLEDENGSTYYTIYIGNRGLSGGWRGFALGHNLEVGDALLFELIEQTKFKVYIIKANDEESNEKFSSKIAEDDSDIIPAGAKIIGF